MAQTNQLVVFSLDDQQYALNLASVERIVRAVEITPLPDSPETVWGVINVEGQVIPVVNTRRRLGLPERDIELYDLFIIINEDGRSLALVADEVKPVMEMAQHQIVASRDLLPGTGYVDGVAKMETGMIVILNVDRILPSDQHGRLTVAIEALGE